MITTRQMIFSCSSLLILTLASCGAPAPQATPQVVTVYSTSAAQPWLGGMYSCAGSSAVISRVDDPSVADLVLRVGEPEYLDVPAHQIDTEEILLVTHRQSPVQNLALEEARALFMGFGDAQASVRVWVYADGEDVQEVFDRSVMDGRNVTSLAWVAASPQKMSDALVNEPNSIGILPRHWKTGDVRDVYSVAEVPVLVLTRSEPAGVLRELLSCLQK